MPKATKNSLMARFLDNLGSAVLINKETFPSPDFIFAHGRRENEADVINVSTGRILGHFHTITF